MRTLPLVVLLLGWATVAIAGPPRPQLQIAFVGFQPAAGAEVDASTLRIAERSVVDGLARAGVPMLTPDEVRARVDETARAQLFACAGTLEVCDLPPAIAPLHVLIGRMSRNGRRVESELIVLRPDGARATLVEVKAGYLQLAMNKWERTAETLPANLARTLKLQHTPPAHLERAVWAAGGGAALVAGGVFALGHASSRDRQLRGIEPPSPPTQEAARAIAVEGATYRNVGVVLVGAGVTGLAFGVYWSLRGLHPAPVPAVVPVQGGAVAVFSGSFP